MHPEGTTSLFTDQQINTRIPNGLDKIRYHYTVLRTPDSFPGLGPRPTLSPGRSCKTVASSVSFAVEVP